MFRAISQKIDNISKNDKIAHELKNPIHGIKGICDVLNSNWNRFDDEIKRNAIGNMYEAICDLERLVNRFFESDDEDINCKLEREDLVSVVKKSIDSIKNFNFDLSKLNISIESEDQEVKCNIDSFWIQQVITNLLVNAVKHAKCKNIQVKIASNDTQISVAVVDDGVGVSDKKISNIFGVSDQEANNQDQSNKSGIGLKICKQVIELHHGRISIANNDNGGLNVNFALPK